MLRAWKGVECADNIPLLKLGCGFAMYYFPPYFICINMLMNFIINTKNIKSCKEPSIL